jgi:hypothetical protein
VLPNADNESNLKELFDQSVSEKCDEYINARISEKLDCDDAIKMVSKLSKAAELFEPLYFFIKVIEASPMQK